MIIMLNRLSGYTTTWDKKMVREIPKTTKKRGLWDFHLYTWQICTQFS